MNELKTKEELKEILKCYGEKENALQENAMVKLIYSSGIGVNDICNLTYFDFLTSVAEYFDNTDICPYCFDEVYSYIRCRDDVIGRWELYNNKTDISYVTFCTAESTHAILDWLYIKNDTHICCYEPLFTGPDGGKLTSEDVQNIFRKMENNTGIRINAHVLRKLFVKTMRDNDLPENYLNYFLGNKVNPFLEMERSSDICKIQYSLKGGSELSLNQSMVTIPLEEYYNLLNNIECEDLLSYW